VERRFDSSSKRRFIMSAPLLDSLAPVDRDTALELAQTLQTDILNYRRVLEAEYTAKMDYARRPRWWRPWKLSPMQVAWQQLYSGDWFPNYTSHQQGELEGCREIIALCRVSNAGTIYLCSRHAEILKEYFA
jgi:hypothetical protein